MIHDGIVEGNVADFLTDLDHAGQLVGFPFADKVRDRCGKYQDFQGGDAAFLVNSLKKVLSHHAFQRL